MKKFFCALGLLSLVTACSPSRYPTPEMDCMRSCMGIPSAGAGNILVTERWLVVRWNRCESACRNP